jgi:hypothetical protein
MNKQPIITSAPVGWVKLHYKLLKWKWYGNAEMVALFVHILLRAYYKTVKADDITIRRGSFITSRRELSRETGISEQTLRTLLHRLETSKEIKVTPTQRGSMITVCKFGKYQATVEETNPAPTQQWVDFPKNQPNQGAKINPQSNQAINPPKTLATDNGTEVNDTCEQTINPPINPTINPTKIQESTHQLFENPENQPTIKKNIKNINNNIYIAVEGARTRVGGEEFLKAFFAPEQKAKLEQLCMSRRFESIENLQRLAQLVLLEWEVTGTTHTTVADARRHLISQCAVKMAVEQRQRAAQQPPRQINQSRKIPSPNEQPPLYGSTAPSKQERTQSFAAHIIHKLANADADDEALGDDDDPFG